MDTPGRRDDVPEPEAVDRARRRLLKLGVWIAPTVLSLTAIAQSGAITVKAKVKAKVKAGAKAAVKPAALSDNLAAQARGTGARDALVLIYGMRCPLRCDFCCHPVEDYGPVKLDKHEAIDWIRQAAALPSFKLVVFTGGEPFVYYREILEVLEATQTTGLSVRIVTAAPWARSVEAAKSRLQPLKERGVTELSLSADPSHQAFVPAAFVENAARAAVEIGLDCEIAGVFWNPDGKVEDAVTVPQGVATSRGMVAPIGRARRQWATVDAAVGEHMAFPACGRPRTWDVTVYPDGEVYPCCSGGFNIEAKLSFGNLRKEPLAPILERMHRDRYARLALGVGFDVVWSLASFKFPALTGRLPDRSTFVSPCQLCVAIHGEPGTLSTLEPVLAYTDRVMQAAEELGVRTEAREVPAG